jgi:chromosome partitioning protein
MPTTVIAVAGRKGGVGKTTISCGLASVFASSNKRVLAIDLDPQSNVAFALDSNPTAPGAADLILGHAPELIAISPNLDILPGGVELANQGVQMAHPEDLADALALYDHEIIIFDCPPGNEHLERMALVAATVVLVVANAHPLAILGAGRVISELELYLQKGRRAAQRWAIVQSLLDKRRKLDKNLETVLQDIYPDVPRLCVHQDTELANTTANQKLLMQYAPQSRGAEDLSMIAKWCLNG